MTPSAVFFVTALCVRVSLFLAIVRIVNKILTTMFNLVKHSLEKSLDEFFSRLEVGL